jgi:fibronectin type 3 domain-containing protein
MDSKKNFSMDIEQTGTTWANMEIEKSRKIIPPSDIWALSLNTEIHIHWFGTEVLGEGYYVYRGEDPGTLKKIGSVFGKYRRHFVDSDVEPGKRYYYAVSGLNERGGDESPISQVVEVVA